MHREVLQYPISDGQSTRLNTVDVYLPSDWQAQDHNDSSKIWVIYIHGGAWRDPDATSETFIPASEILPDKPQVQEHVAGMASINYRLSPYPAKQGDDPPDDPARNARHPDHIQDLLSALKFLQDKYGFGERYVLAGHSAGATLVWHVLMYAGSTTSITGADATTAMTNPKIALPQAIVSAAGIYDLPSLVRRHEDIPLYQEIVRGAFGDASEDWLAASPLHWIQKHDLHREWSNGRVIVLAHSKEDGQVESEQVIDMWNAVRAEDQKTDQRGQDADTETVKKANGDGSGRHQELIWHKGEHDSVWKEGTQLVDVILAALDRII